MVISLSRTSFRFVRTQKISSKYKELGILEEEMDEEDGLGFRGALPQSNPLEVSPIEWRGKYCLSIICSSSSFSSKCFPSTIWVGHVYQRRLNYLQYLHLNRTLTKPSHYKWVVPLYFKLIPSFKSISTWIFAIARFLISRICTYILIKNSMMFPIYYRMCNALNPSNSNK